MVAIEELADAETSAASTPTPTPTPSPSPSRERLRDAEDIENILSHLTRPTAKMRVESLIQTIRNEASERKAIEEAESKSESKSESAAAPTRATHARTHAQTQTHTRTHAQTHAQTHTHTRYTTIDRFAFDAGGSRDKFVTLYLPLPGVGSLPDKTERVRCEFGETSFDVTVTNLRGRNYRLRRDDLEHPIDPQRSKRIVKADKVVVKLHKRKGNGGHGSPATFDYWSKLTDPKKKDKASNADPSAGLMGMMKDMYDSGDDKMRKMIGETMLKQRNGELNNSSNSNSNSNSNSKDDGPGGLGDPGNF
eukprot:CAMPEP_0168188790 /NCGR_PEP_ID=MMETSP0139_2-20121125/15932_1 /TAXON_ID=44445 /ORGANISM="Pseudo-nitzschia australis, Strain 10249 10 AB" /LENGTH=306 /DNA_ID=CAMNT_0008111445 /DNA_START=165 /DNA_END=1085 /DNA_ORIENTATION=+